MQNAFVKVRPMCDRCRNSFDWCFRVERNVPEPLRCSPGSPVGTGGGGVSGGDDSSLRCSVCGLRWAAGISEVQQMVEDATRHGWGQHLRNGAVVLSLPA